MSLEVKIQPQELLSLLRGVKQTVKGEYQCSCPFCGKEKHFYISVVEEHFPWSCKKCQEDGNIYKLLKHLGVLSEYVNKSINVNGELQVVLNQKESIEEVVVNEPDKPLPRNFERVYDNEYLKSRNFTPQDFYNYFVGVCTKSSKLSNYVIFPVLESGVCKGWVGRCVLNKKQCDEQGVLRYKNSKETNFGNLLYGFDEINKQTKVVIIVEGIFDKIKIDKILQLHKQNDVKCLCSFGNKISESQLLKIKCTNVVKIVLFYDLDAIQEMKRNATKIAKYFELEIACLYNGKDPDESSEEDIFEALTNTQTSKKFYHDKCSIKKLK